MVNFELEKKYQNAKGVFRVIGGINTNRLEVRYDETNKTAILDTAIAERISIPFSPTADSILTMDVPYTEQGANYYTALGVLCAKSFFHVFIAHKHADRFAMLYEDATGKQVDPTINGYCLHPEGRNKFGIEVQIVFHQDFLQYVNINQSIAFKTQGKRSINNNDFAFHLFSLGFGIGNTHDKTAILANVPMQYHNDFNTGFNA